VAGVTTDFKRNLLRGLAWDAEDRALELETVLKEACRARVEETRTGKVLVGVSGNGASATYALPQSASRISPAEIDGACGQLYSLYEIAIEQLATDGNASPTDDQIRIRMLKLLVSNNEAVTDRSGVCA
jgi:hypothetical protein